MVNKRAGLPAEWKSTEDEIKTLPLKAKISLRRGMQQHVLITILVVEGRLEVVGKDIPRKVAQMIELKRKVADPQLQIQVNGKTKYGEATRSTRPQ